MIKAKEARLLLANSEEAIRDQLNKIEKVIMAAIKEGKNYIEYTCPTDEFTKPLIQELKMYDYTVTQTHSRGIYISW